MQMAFRWFFLITTIFFFQRFYMMATHWQDFMADPTVLVAVFFKGAFFDFRVALASFSVVLFFEILAPKIVRFSISIILLSILLFSLIAEIFFWNEFTNRFNFIAVDYLIYTTEVINNAMESYPIKPLLALIALSAVGFSWWIFSAPKRSFPFTKRLVFFGASSALTFLLFQIPNGKTNGPLVASEIAKSGVESFVRAYFENEIRYSQFYSTIPTNRALELMKDENNLERSIQGGKPGYRKNVVLIAVESLSAEFLTEFGQKENLTPNLDKLSKESLFFTNFFATGTRTVRGLEALTLSIPPTPGNSIVRRSKNEGLFTLGTPFQERGYSTKFIYGGYGYFDNMNNFFSGNGFSIVDRGSLSKDEIQFANAWGVSDEDLFNRTLKEADKAFAVNKNPFFYFVLTTSNHRPYTYPQKIDIQSGSTRQGAVKYTDYAIGKFLKDASSKPWFKDTIFVVVADHCASSAGKVAVPIAKYHIPLFIYSPGFIKPQRIEKLASQIDLAPTLLGLMNFTYRTKFFGKDLLKESPNRVLLGTYQELGFYNGKQMVLLRPKSGTECNQVLKNWDLGEVCESGLAGALVERAIAYYQTSAELFQSGGLKAMAKKIETVSK